MENFEIPPYISYAIGLFLACIFVESYWSWKYQKKYYRLNDTIANLSVGIYSLVFGKFIDAVLVVFFIFLYEKFRFLDYSYDNPWVWVWGYFLVDFLYYWFHRTSHEVGVIWGSHEAHHQSEEYNYSAALRQGTLQQVFSFPFFGIAALLGIHPLVFYSCHQFNLIYQFLLHTRGIDRLGILEWVMNTPSHHRVHHGINPEYIDRNHAGTFIIWDRMFGTFQEEKAEVVYGTVKPLQSWNPLWASVQYWVQLMKQAGEFSGFVNKILVWISIPGWRPKAIGGMLPIPQVSAKTFVKYNPKLSRHLGQYVTAQFTLTLFILLGFLLMDPILFHSYGVLLGFSILLSLFCNCLMMEGKLYALYLEVFRHSATIFLVLYLSHSWTLNTIFLSLETFSLGWILYLFRSRNAFPEMEASVFTSN